MFCLIVLYLSASRSVLNVFFTSFFFFYVNVLRTVLNVLRLIVCHVSALGTVLRVFCQLFATFEFRALFFIYSVAFLSL